jgi:hypothetical protein
MRGWTRIAIAGALPALLLLTAPGASAARTRTERARAEFPRAAAGAPLGRIAVTRWPASGRRAERVRIVLRLSRLDVGATYSLWGDDPVDELIRLEMFAPYRVTAARRNLTLKYDTRKGPLPFDATFDDLAGRVLQVRDASGTVVVGGGFPSLVRPESPRDGGAGR